MADERVTDAEPDQRQRLMSANDRWAPMTDGANA